MEERLRFFENRMLRKIFRVERDEVYRERRGLYIQESYDLYSCGILKIQFMWKLHFLCKNRNTLSEQKLILFGNDISTMYLEIFPEFARPA